MTQRSGRSVNHRCVTPSPTNIHHPPCHRLVKLPSTTTEHAESGNNSFAFTVRNLRAGTYELVATPVGGISHTITLKVAD